MSPTSISPVPTSLSSRLRVNSSACVFHRHLKLNTCKCKCSIPILLTTNLCLPIAFHLLFGTTYQFLQPETKMSALTWWLSFTKRSNPSVRPLRKSQRCLYFHCHQLNSSHQRFPPSCLLTDLSVLISPLLIQLPHTGSRVIF